MKTNSLKLQTWLIAGLYSAIMGGVVFSVAPPLVASVSAAQTCTDAKGFLTLPVWYRGLNPSPSDCNIVSPDAVGGLSNFIWLIVLNVIEIGLQLAGYIAVFYILYGGFQFLISTGSPDGSAKARKTILNAVIGLVISIASVGIVNLILGVLK